MVSLCLLTATIFAMFCESSYAATAEDENLRPILHQVEKLGRHIRVTSYRAGRRKGERALERPTESNADQEVQNISEEFIESRLQRLDYNLYSVNYQISLRQNERTLEEQAQNPPPQIIEIGFIDYLRPPLLYLFRGALDGRVCGQVDLSERKRNGSGRVTFVAHEIELRKLNLSHAVKLFGNPQDYEGDTSFELYSPYTETSFWIDVRFRKKKIAFYRVRSQSVRAEEWISTIAK